jgi:hypothetical protein
MTDVDFYLLLLLFDRRLALMVDLASDVGFRTLFGLVVCRFLNIAQMASILRDTDTSSHEHLQAKQYADQLIRIHQGIFSKFKGVQDLHLLH